MKTIQFTQTMWDSRTADAHLDRAVGDTRQDALCRPAGPARAGEGKVIDLAAWKAENLVELDGPQAEEPESGLAQYEGRELVRRRRRKHAAAQARAELAATLSVAGLMIAMILRVLVF